MESTKQISLAKTVIYEEEASTTVAAIISKHVSDLKVTSDLFSVRINGKNAALTDEVHQDDVLQIIPIFSGGK